MALAPHVVVDLWEVEAGATDDREARLLAGELLPGWDEPWVDADALWLGPVAVGCDPLRETAHREVIEVHLEEGNVGEALRRYDAYRRLLHAELELAPSPAMRRVIDEYLDGMVGDVAPEVRVPSGLLPEPRSPRP